MYHLDTTFRQNLPVVAEAVAVGITNSGWSVIFCCVLIDFAADDGRVSGTTLEAVAGGDTTHDVLLACVSGAKTGPATTIEMLCCDDFNCCL